MRFNYFINTQTKEVFGEREDVEDSKFKEPAFVKCPAPPNDARREFDFEKNEWCIKTLEEPNGKSIQ